MKKYKFILCAIGFSAAFCISANAQSLLQDKDSITTDLGFDLKSSLATTSAAVSVITAEELQQTSAINLSDALYGRLLGLTALKNGGFAGDESYGAWFNIRGQQTTSENGILILVDGVPRPINRLTVNEVESVTVLRDAAAVALLGYRGVNGAILVKTKHGKEGKLKVDVGYNHKFTFSPTVPEFADAYTYAQAYNEARSNDGLTPMYSELELDLFKNGTDPYFYPNVNWKDEVLKDMGSEDQLNVAIHGGTDKVKYYTMLDYTASSGLLKGTEQGDYNSQLKYSKANIRTNLDFKITPTTDMTVNVLANFIETNQPAAGGGNDVFYQIYRLPASAFPITTPDGIWGGNQNYGDANPIARVQSTGYEKTHQRALYADAKLTQNLGMLIDGLSASVKMSYDNLSVINEKHSKSFQYGFVSYGGEIGDKNNVSSTVYGDKINNLEYSKSQSNQWRASHFTFSLDYAKKFGNHSVAASAIYNTEAEIGMGRYNTFYRANVMGYFHYDWKNKLIADLVLAGNGSNRSYPEKWAFSPTASLAYLFANNQESNILNFGKVRASFGVQHTDYVPINGIWLESYDGGHGSIVLGPNYGANWGNYLSYFPLTNFSLETAYKYNLGVEMRLANCLDITADIYYNRRSNIMLSANDLNSWVVGRPNSYAIGGKVDSYGFELGLNYAKQLTKDFSLQSAAFLTWGKNEIVDYIELPSESYQSKIGQRVDQVYGLEAIGFFKNEADIASSPSQHFSQVKPGDIKYKDQNGDNIIDEDDAVYFGYGSNVPDFNYAFSLGAKYKNFGFNVLFQGITGLTKNMNTVGVWDCLKNNNNLSMHYLENAWSSNRADNSAALYPRLTTQDNPNNYQSSTVWFKNINWLKLRNVELYYFLPTQWIKGLHMESAKITIKGENLLTISNMDVMDPELMNTNYPSLKGVSAGFVLNF